MNSSTAYWTPDLATAFTQHMLGSTQEYGVLFYDADLRILGWNEGAHYITGWTASELLGQPTTLLFVPEDRERKLEIHEAGTARIVGVCEDERWHMRKDGSRFWSSGVSIVLSAENDQPVVFLKVFRDVTHLRARMKYLENVLQESSAQQAQKELFIGTIAHELRNPLSPLKTAIELMKRSPANKPSPVNTIRVMERQVGFLETLVEDLVDLTRVQAGKMSINYKLVVMQEFVQDALESCQSAADAKGLSIYQSIPPIPIQLEFDPKRMHQVIVNLLNNAIKYTQAGGCIWLTATLDQTHFVCYVKDNGQGISPELLPQIFNIFTQADNKHAERGAGLGIGLALVKEIVALHQGTVEVRSEGPGKGSEFVVRIPLRQPYGSEPEPFPAPEQKNNS
jgi:two-component system CheB/CheR fusion protein